MNPSKILKITLKDFYNLKTLIIEGFFMHMEKHECQFIGCHRDVEVKETYKVLDHDLNMYSFTTYLCNKHYMELHNFKEKVNGDFSVFLKNDIRKTQHT